MESHTEFDGRAGRNRFRQSDLKNGVVVGVAIVGLDELHFVGEIAGALDLEFGHSDRAAILFVPAGIGSNAPSAARCEPQSLEWIEAETRSYIDGRGKIAEAGR